MTNNTISYMQLLCRYTNIFLPFLGTLFQYYDYAIFGLFSYKFAETFMPSLNFNQNLLYVYFIIFISSFARVVGSLFFGAIGDSLGKGTALKIATCGIFFPMTLVFLLPSYENIGLIATILFIIARISVTFFLSGEIDGAKIYVYESYKNSSYIALSLIITATQIGAIIATLVVLFGVNNNLFSWKYTFLIGSFCAVIMYYLRHSYNAFEVDINKKKITFNSLMNINKAQIFKNALVLGSLGGLYQYFIFFIPVFLSKVLQLIPLSHISIITNVGISTLIISSLFFGYVQDKYSIKYLHIILTSFVIFVICIYKFCPHALKLNYLSIHYITYFLIFFSYGGFNLMSQVKMIKALSAEYTYTNLSLAHSLGSVILSSAINFVSMYLWISYNSIVILSLIPIVLFLIIFNYLNS
jgi:MFS family permease